MKETLSTLYDLLGRAVLLSIPKGKKGPRGSNGWQTTNFVQTELGDYYKRLQRKIREGGNIGVLLGANSENLKTIDIDDDERAREFCELNPWTKNTLRTKGQRGGNIWLRPKPGTSYPNTKAVFNLLTADGKKYGEWRCGDGGGAQTVIYGKHPSGLDYKILRRCKPVVIDFSEIKWPADVILPWEDEPEQAQPKQHPRKGDQILEEEQTETTPTERPFPEISDAAFDGILGEIVKLVEPHTEASRAALLAQLLVVFGNIIDRKAYSVADGAYHYTNLFACLVGQSSRGRKGTSLNQVLRLFDAVEPVWRSDHVRTGMSSGEGLIWAVRDPIYKSERNKRTGQVEEVLVDNGVDDKRLLVTETEFAQPLKVMSRPTNILSPVLRSAWETGNLNTLVKNDPARATGAHVSIVGHITEHELKRELAECELFNGFANRFLWCCVKRSKLLPHGGMLPENDYKRIIEQLTVSIKNARAVEAMKRRDPDAKALWEEAYKELTRDAVGLAGDVTSRAESQVLRLSMIYALADGKTIIEVEHLNAALAFWQYCEQSALYLFGDRLADSNAQRILDELRTHPSGMTRKEISVEIFQRNIKSTTLDCALISLESLGFAYRKTEATGGRPAERWFIKR